MAGSTRTGRVAGVAMAGGSKEDDNCAEATGSKGKGSTSESPGCGEDSSKITSRLLKNAPVNLSPITFHLYGITHEQALLRLFAKLGLQLSGDAGKASATPNSQVTQVQFGTVHSLNSVIFPGRAREGVRMKR